MMEEPFSCKISTLYHDPGGTPTRIPAPPAIPLKWPVFQAESFLGKFPAMHLGKNPAEKYVFVQNKVFSWIPLRILRASIILAW